MGRSCSADLPVQAFRRFVQQYGGYLYFLSKVSGVMKLYRYRGGVVTEVTGASIPNSGNYKLHVAGDFLYISGHSLSTGTVNFIRRYNGISFFTLPYSGPGTSVDKAYAVTGTARSYFTSHERIIYFDGSTVRQVFFNTGESISAIMWRNNLYFTTGVGASPDRYNYLYRLDGASLTMPTLPAGAKIAPVPHTNPEVYNDQLFVAAVYKDGIKKVLSYNGSSFSSFFTITGSVSSGVRLFIREGNLMIQPNFPNGNNAFEYNSGVFTEIIAPPGRLLFPFINSTTCNHLWLNYYTDATGIKWAYAKEKKDCPPPPPPAA